MSFAFRSLTARPLHARRGVARIAAFALLAGASVSLMAPAAVHADSTSDERARVQHYLDALDQLDSQMSQTNEDQLDAQSALAHLQDDIAVLKGQVTAQSGELTSLQQVLTSIAVDRFTASGSATANPLLSDSSAFAEAQQRDALAKVAMNAGIADADNAQAVVDQLTDRQRKLTRKQREAANLVAVLATKGDRLVALQGQYQALTTQAKKDLKQAVIDQEVARREKLAEQQAAAAYAAAQKIEAENEKRAAAAAAAAARRKAQTAKPASGGRGGGGTVKTRVTKPTKRTAPTPTPTTKAGSKPTKATTKPATKPTKTTKPRKTSTPPTPTKQPTRYPGVSGKAGVAVAAAMAQRGTPYHFAMSSPGKGFDCSGLTSYAWGRAGVYLPHQSRQQYAVTPHVPESAAAPGDLIFYYSPISHVGLYIGGGKMVHAPHTGDVVKVVSVQWGKAVGVGRPG